MNPRLNELLRQRELIRAHLHWIEQEIKSASGMPSPPDGAAATTSAAPQSGNASDCADLTVTAANAITGSASTTPSLELPALDSRSLQADVRRGCLLYFLAAFGVLGAVVGFVIWRY